MTRKMQGFHVEITRLIRKKKTTRKNVNDKLLFL